MPKGRGRGDDTASVIAASRYEALLGLDFAGAQIPSLIAVTIGLKPAADIWVDERGLQKLPMICAEFGLCFFVDALFDRFDEALLSRIPASSFNTTRAALATRVGDRVDAHVFVARNRECLEAAVASGWYPLVVGTQLVGKPYPDHEWFGRALGYPECCIGFFGQRNNWSSDNTYGAAFRNTDGSPLAVCNALPRHGSLYLTPHIPCSFRCGVSQRYGEALAEEIGREAPRYLDAILAHLRRPMLCLSELKIFAFDGSSNGVCIEYTGVLPIAPTPADDPLLALLKEGDRVLLDGCLVRIFRQRRQIHCYLGRGDVHGPEAPLILCCD